jgi:DNA-directed RNA polymerase beta subunit
MPRIKTEIPLWILFRALGVVSDKDIVELILGTDEDVTYMSIMDESIQEAADIQTQEQALADPQALGQRVAFYDLTGEWTALSVIEHLADLGKQVTVFTPVAGFAWRATIYSTLSNRKRLRDKGVRLVLLRQLLAYDGRVLQLEDVSTGEVLEETGFDSVVGAQYGRSDQTMELGLKAAQGHRPRWHLAGDCLSPRTALEAVYEGHALARAL